MELTPYEVYVIQHWFNKASKYRAIHKHKEACIYCRYLWDRMEKLCQILAGK